MWLSARCLDSASMRLKALVLDNIKPYRTFVARNDKNLTNFLFFSASMRTIFVPIRGNRLKSYPGHIVNFSRLPVQLLQ